MVAFPPSKYLTLVVVVSKTIWSFIIIILLHSFFSCAVAAGHVEDNEHTFDFALEHHVHTEHQSDIPDNLDPNHDHQFHAHVTCFTGYSLVAELLLCPAAAIAHTKTSFINNPSQPPTPPPNA
ncbi:hypothetical protein CWE21_05495 [Pseudidiomarina aquimaris]|uniref:Cobalt transporter n=1 Tax=Pseudidiomarina aquimaris TaxID=641841 RepID=A0A432XJD2_9GAMM|nr:hypothetical protein CWE21_05495 [Pseudidiomarina aquimaris]